MAETKDLESVCMYRHGLEREACLEPVDSWGLCGFHLGELMAKARESTEPEELVEPEDWYW